MTDRRPLLRIADPAFPLINQPGDAAILRREEEARTRELTDLSETLTDEEYAAADDEWHKWLDWLAS